MFTNANDIKEAMAISTIIEWCNGCDDREVICDEVDDGLTITIDTYEGSEDLFDELSGMLVEFTNEEPTFLNEENFNNGEVGYLALRYASEVYNTSIYIEVLYFDEDSEINECNYYRIRDIYDY